MHFLSKFRQTSKIGMLKRVTKLKICCPVVFSEELIAVFKLKNLKLALKKTKKPKFSKFQCFYAANFQSFNVFCSIGQIIDRLRGLEC